MKLLLDFRFYHVVREPKGGRRERNTGRQKEKGIEDKGKDGRKVGGTHQCDMVLSSPEPPLVGPARCSGANDGWFCFFSVETTGHVFLLL